MADGRHIENRFGYISAIYYQSNVKFHVEVESRWDTGRVTKIANCENWRWQTAAILKMVLSLYFSDGSSEFDDIWSADANFGSKNGHMAINENFPNPNWQTVANWKSTSSDIYAIYAIRDAVIKQQI